MRILFSEATPDYAHYLFPYAVWAVPEKGDNPSDLFEAGFLPASRQLDRFYLCRHVRLRFAQFSPSSENRRILRKGEGITAELVARKQYRFTAQRKGAFLDYAERKFGPGIMTSERLTDLLASPLISHLLVFTDNATGRTVGTVTLFLEEPRTAFYYYAFYDLDHPVPNLGMLMMTTAALRFAAAGFHHLYLGTVYSRNALYKTQFRGAEFFNGYRWSDNLKELKHLLQRDAKRQDHHLLESREYLDLFQEGDLSRVTREHGLRLGKR